MKMRNTEIWLLGFLLAIASVGGFAQNNPEIPRLTVSSPEAATALLQEFQATDPASTTPAFGEFAKLALAGIDEQVMLRVITNTPDVYKLGVDQILWLRDVGVSKEVINAMMAHDLEVNTRQVVQALATPSAPVQIAWPASWLKSPDLRATKTAAASSQSKASTPSPPSATATNRIPSPPPAPALPEATVESVKALSGLDLSQTRSVSEVSGMRKNPTEQEQELAFGYQSNPYPVRLPYPVKLLDPIIIMVTPW